MPAVVIPDHDLSSVPSPYEPSVRILGRAGTSLHDLGCNSPVEGQPFCADLRSAQVRRNRLIIRICSPKR